MALLIIANVIVAFYMDDLPKESKEQIVLLHRSLGVLILQLAIVRIIWIFMKPAPAMPPGIPALEVRIGKIVQHALYLLMLAVPFSGFFMTVTKGKAVSFFGLFDLPLILEKNEELHEIFEEGHEIMAWVLIALTLLHIAAGIKHKFKNDGIFERMWFTKKKVDFLTAKLTKD